MKASVVATLFLAGASAMPAKSSKAAKANTAAKAASVHTVQQTDHADVDMAAAMTNLEAALKAALATHGMDVVARATSDKSDKSDKSDTSADSSIIDGIPIVGSLVSPVVDAVLGALGYTNNAKLGGLLALANSKGGSSALTGTVGNLTGGLTGGKGGSNPLSSVTNTLGGLTGGLTGGKGGSNPLSSVTNTLGGLTGGLTGGKGGSNPLSSVTSTLGGLTGGLTGGKGGSSPLSSVTGALGGLTGGLRRDESSAQDDQAEEHEHEERAITVDQDGNIVARSSNPASSVTSAVNGATSGLASSATSTPATLSLGKWTQDRAVKCYVC